MSCYKAIYNDLQVGSTSRKACAITPVIYSDLWMPAKVSKTSSGAGFRRGQWEDVLEIGCNDVGGREEWG